MTSRFAPVVLAAVMLLAPFAAQAGSKKWSFTVDVCGPTQTRYASGATKSDAIKSFCKSECSHFAAGGYFNEQCNSECNTSWATGRGGGESYNLPRSCTLTVK
jgi:hypothetical protein